MASDIVQFRENAEALAYLRSKGINPNEFGRDAFQAALRRLRTDEAMQRLAKVPARLPRDIATVLREERESH